MSRPSTPADSGGSQSRVLTRAQRQVLAFLFLHDGPVKQLDLSGSTILAMGGGVVTVLRSLENMGLVQLFGDGCHLNPTTREVMQLGHTLNDPFTPRGLEGVRHVL